MSPLYSTILRFQLLTRHFPPPKKKLFKTLISSNFTHSATVILNCLCLTLTVFFEAQIILCQVILCQVFFFLPFPLFLFSRVRSSVFCLAILYPMLSTDYVFSYQEGKDSEPTLMSFAFPVMCLECNKSTILRCIIKEEQRI